MKTVILLKYLLWVQALFFFSEFLFHFFGLPILEHDKIFLSTHDRYIALFALILAGILVTIATDIKKYNAIFIVVMVGILFLMINGYVIEHTGGYAKAFSTQTLDRDIQWIGYGSLLWYIVTWWAWWKNKKTA